MTNLSIEELKQRFGPPMDVAPYGECLVIQRPEFDTDVEAYLREQGYSCHYGDLDRHPVVFVSLQRKPRSNASSATEKAPSKKRGGGHGVPWTDKEDGLLVALWNEEKTSARIVSRFQEKYPKRSEASILNHIWALQKAKRITPRFTINHGKEPKKPKPAKSDKSQSSSSEHVDAETVEATLKMPFIVEKLTKDVVGILSVLDEHNVLFSKVFCMLKMQEIEIRERLGDFVIPPKLLDTYADAILTDSPESRTTFLIKANKLLEASR